MTQFNTNQLSNLLDSFSVRLSNQKPSEWIEENMIMKKPFAGPYRFSKTPYMREIVDCLSPFHPAKTIAFMKGAQIGASAGLIYPGVGWMIKNNPGNCVVMVGAPDLIEKTTEKIDLMIEACKLRSLIRPQVVRNRASKSGDTDFKKEFPNGYVSIGSANNHKNLRQVDLQFGFIDDFEAVKKSSKESGDTLMLIDQRFASYSNKKKLFLISTPELKDSSNIEPAFLLGDQRKYLIPCPCCGEFIELKWSCQVEGNEKETAGITWKLSESGKLIYKSIGYICQKCEGWFNDSKKMEWLNKGYWKPTAEPSQDGFYSYHISALYAPHGMYDWSDYVGKFLKAQESLKSGDNSLMKTFTNLCLGETFINDYEEIKATQLQKNIRQYEINTVPQKICELDGNEKIILLTCACDLNGIVDDARLDYEVVGWSTTGSSYSITSGSIGTFIPREGENKKDRERWTYELYKKNSVWSEFDKVLETVFDCDNGQKMKIFIAGVDSGHYTDYAYAYIEGQRPCLTIALKGKDNDKYTPFGADIPYFKVAMERKDLFLVNVNKVKDVLATQMNLKHDFNSNFNQEHGFMNFPEPSNGKYSYLNYFSHFESEKRETSMNKDNRGSSTRWVKKTTTSQNHFWDVRVYNIALKEIIAHKLCTEMKLKNKSWAEFVNAI